MSNSDYNNFTSGPSCSYANLGNYNDGYSMQVAPQGKVISGGYVVPTWSPISYDSLTMGVGTCSGYANIMDAYGASAGSCQTTYRTSVCGGSNMMAGSRCGTGQCGRM